MQVKTFLGLTCFPLNRVLLFSHSLVIAVRLSGHVSNSSCPSIMLPAVLFPDPDRPSSTKRSSGEEDGNEVVVGEEKTRD